MRCTGFAVKLTCSRGSASYVAAILDSIFTQSPDRHSSWASSNASRASHHAAEERSSCGGGSNVVDAIRASSPTCARAVIRVCALMLCPPGMPLASTECSPSIAIVTTPEASGHASSFPDQRVVVTARPRSAPVDTLDLVSSWVRISSASSREPLRFMWNSVVVVRSVSTSPTVLDSVRVEVDCCVEARPYGPTIIPSNPSESAVADHMGLMTSCEERTR